MCLLALLLFSWKTFIPLFLWGIYKSCISLHEMIRCGVNICLTARSSLFPLVSHFCVVRLSLCHNVSELLRLLGLTGGLMMFLNYEVIKHQYQKTVRGGGRRRTSGSCLHMYKEILQLVAVALTVAAFLINEFKLLHTHLNVNREISTFSTVSKFAPRLM